MGHRKSIQLGKFSLVVVSVYSLPASLHGFQAAEIYYWYGTDYLDML